MKSFESLSYGGQIKRLRQLAKKALLNYDLKITEITTLDHGENTSFKLKTQADKISQNSSGGDRYVLRIYRHNKHDRAVIQSELIWLTSLLRDTDITVPQPILNQQNSLFTTVTVPEIPEPRYCVLFKWLPGRFVKTKVSNNQIKQIGRFLARLHHYSQHFRPPKDFKRPVWNEDGLLGKFPFSLPVESSTLSQSDRKLLNLAALEIRERLKELDQNPQSFGLIHGDLHLGNCKFYRGKIQVFDFDDCGWGYYIYDLAVTLYYLRRHDNFDALQTSLVEGYQAVCSEAMPLGLSLPNQYEFYLEAMMAARRLHLLRDLFLRQDNPKLKAQIPKFVNFTIEQINRFINPINV